MPNAMPIRRFAYISRATQTFQAGDLTRLQSLSQRNNRIKDITGALGFTGHYFLQYIEGRDPVIQDVMRIIRRDGRHADVLECEFPPGVKRRFGQWSMRFFDSSVLDGDVRRIHHQGTLTPEEADWLIQRMVQTLPPGESLHALDDCP